MAKPTKTSEAKGRGKNKNDAVETELTDGILGTDQDNEIFGTDSSENIFGYGGDDEIRPYAGYDVLDGGEGSDTYIVEGYTGVKEFADTGLGVSDYDIVKAYGDATTLSLSQFGPDCGIEEISSDGYAGFRIWGTGSNDNLDFSATTLSGVTHINTMGGNDTLTGSNGDDNLFGGSGDDVVSGGAGDDHVDGGSGNDVVSGGAGNDTIVDGYGADTMAGGDGADRFVLSDASASGDVIEDFDPSEGDTIELAYASQMEGYESWYLTQDGDDAVLNIALDDGSSYELATLQDVVVADFDAATWDSMVVA
ncbi:calcium-binding protein [Ruegeria sp. SCP11]|uniref:calcium-binding protein n=1 Tax=Ruegeria sp. SCP11 TaxID=3141378 RepID=UPI00333B52F6